ncbi:predicted protein [Nematostella vectensis]|uniref:Neuralized-like protein 2 n=1 Tax=Nematostella vectensis TaxID=45351 RepID=A7SWU1_NEMVE|nr:neuralized-like protein 2 [Nematostella vectensis]EDO31830.1 predicted protein [Nematostella vectensis]|eukprot:XP_001623930.1 predicted protein [Nematostella vectensis]
MMRFHPKHGSHITLSPCQTVATRCKSFANAVVFSNRPLSTSETFVFEIYEQEQGWSGHVRCGVTTHNPNFIKVPPYLLPDLAQMGTTWVFALKPSNNKPLGDEQLRECGHNYQRLPQEDEVDNTIYCGEKAATNSNIRPTDEGSRIGIRVSYAGNLYFYINGKKFGPCATDLPSDSELFVTLDVYGSTKAVKIIQCGAVPSLLNLCCSKIRILTLEGSIKSLPIPKLLKQYILSF